MKKEIEVKLITGGGDVLTTNGELKINQKYQDVTNILGELKYEGDYHDFDFYCIQNPIRISTRKLTGKIHLKKGMLDAFILIYDNYEITKLTSLAKKEKDKIRMVKEDAEDLIQQITLTTGRKVNGRKYFKKFDRAFIDLKSPTGKWPYIVMSFSS